MKGKAIICIAMIVAVLASAVGIVSGELFNVDDCPECPNAALPLPCGSFGLSIGNYNPVFASEPSLKVLSCLYNYNYGRADNPDSGVIKIGAYLSPDHGLDADKALSDFKLARKECLEYCESPGTEKLRDKNDGDDREFVYISKDDMFCCGPCYRYEVGGYLLYRENYLIYVKANAEYKDQKERYCEPVGDSYACKYVDPDDKTHLSDANDAIIRFDALAECAKRVIDKKCGEGLSRVEIEQVPKHVVKDVSARFIVYAYDSNNQIISTSDLTYEWYIDADDNQMATSTQTLDYTFDTLGSHKVSCRVTYGVEKNLGKLDVKVEPFRIDFKPPTKFSPMAGENAVVEFRVNTLARVCFDRVVIRKAYYPKWYFDDYVDIDKEMTVDPDQWYKVEIWDGRINNGRPAINGPYTVKLRAKLHSWWFFEDKTCKVLVYDDPGKFVSIESVHRPLQSRGKSLAQGYARLGECGEWSVMITKVLGSLGAGVVVTWYIPATWPPVAGFIIGSVIVGCGMEVVTFSDLAYTARYDYWSETISLSPCVTDIDKKYGPIPGC